MSITPYVNEREREWVAVMAPAVELAKQVANTDFVPKSLRGNGPAIVAAILYGDELGLGPMQALAKIAVIDGKPSLSAETQRALILAAGHDIWLVESNATKVTVAGRRSGSDHTSTVTWTMDDAKRAGLAGRQNWRTYPRQMLIARATAELARLIFADAIGGLAATEEVVEESHDGSEYVEPKPKGNRRKRAAAAEPETSVVPEIEEAPAELPPLPDEPFTANGTPDDDIPFGDGPVLVETDEPPATGNTIAASTRDKPATKAQKDKLNLVVTKLRETGTIQTRHLWGKLAIQRYSLEVEDRDAVHAKTDEMIALLEGVGEDGELHWSPLRDSLTRAEASMLIDALEGLE